MAMFRNVMVYLGLGPDDEYDENYLYDEDNVDFEGLERRTSSGVRSSDGVRIFDDDEDLGVGAVRPLRPVPDGFQGSEGGSFGSGQSSIPESRSAFKGSARPSQMEHPSAGVSEAEGSPSISAGGGKPDLFESRSFGVEADTKGSDAKGGDPRPESAPASRYGASFPTGDSASGRSLSGLSQTGPGNNPRPEGAQSAQAGTNQQPQNDRSSFGMEEFSQPQGSGAKPRTVVPRSFDDAKNVANEYRNGAPVIMNLREADKDTGRRLLDFSSGMVYGLGGAMEKLAANVFLITPEGVVVSADDRRRMEERGYGR